MAIVIENVEYLTPKQAAGIAGVNQQKIYREIRQQRLSARKLAGWTVLIPLADFDLWRQRRPNAGHRRSRK